MMVETEEQQLNQILVCKPSFAIIAAVDKDGGFSKDGKIPWYYSEDFHYFKAVTQGGICVMGRNTYNDINTRLGKAAEKSVLPNRTCLVLSSSMDPVENATVVRTYGELFAKIDEHLTDKPKQFVGPVFFIGGGGIFNRAIKLVDKVVLTVINESFECDAMFPTEYLVNNFKEISVRKGRESDKLRYVVFERI